MHTEEKAKKTKCQFEAITMSLRVLAMNVLAVSVKDNKNDLAKTLRHIEEQVGGMSVSCIASKCMMWTWDKEHNTGSTRFIDYKGYCGLTK